MDKNKVHKILVIGSGLSSLSFIDTYLQRYKEIDVISFENKKIKITETDNSHIFKILPSLTNSFILLPSTSVESSIATMLSP